MGIILHVVCQIYSSGSGTCEGTPHTRKKWRNLKGSSPKEMRRLVSWQKQEQCWTKNLWAEARAETKKQEREREEVHVALQHAAGFHCLEERKDCEELKPKPKEKWIFVNKKSEGAKHRTAWVSMYEMWKRKQIHEDARNMYRTKIPGKKFGKMVTAPSGRS